MFLIRNLWVASYNAIDFQCQIVNDNFPWHFLDPVIITSTMTTEITSSHKSMNRFVSFSFHTFDKGCLSALLIFERPPKILQIKNLKNLTNCRLLYAGFYYINFAKLPLVYFMRPPDLEPLGAMRHFGP